MSETQNVETNKPEIGSNNSFETPIIDKVDIPEPAPTESSEPATAASPEAEGELPEFAKCRLGKAKKKYEIKKNVSKKRLNQNFLPIFKIHLKRRESSIQILKR